MEEDEVPQEDNFCIKSPNFSQVKLQHFGVVTFQVVDEDCACVDDCQFVFPYFPELAVVCCKLLMSGNGDLPHS